MHAALSWFAPSQSHSRFWILLALLILMPHPSSARQLAFERDEMTQHYRWQPPASVADGKVQTLTLNLLKQS